MSIRWRVLLWLCILVVAYGSVLQIIQLRVIAPSFAALERQDARQNVARCVLAIERESEHLAKTCADWANWDDTYRYVADRNRAYVAANLDNALDSASVDVLSIYDRSGRLVWGRGRDPRTGQPLPEGILTGSVFPSATLPGQRGRGVVVVQGRALIVAYQPILTSAQAGPARGTLVMARLLTDIAIAELAEQSQVALAVQPIVEGRPGTPAAPLPAQPAGPADISLSVHGDVLRAQQVLTGVDGQPALLLQVDMPREITAHGAAAMRYASWSLAGAGVLFLLVVVLALHFSVLHPLAELTRQVVAIGGASSLELRLPPRGDGELGVLAREFNRTLEQFEQHRAERQHEQQAQLRFLQAVLEAVPSPMFYKDAQGRYQGCNSAFARLILGTRREEVIGRTVFDFGERLPTELARRYHAADLQLLREGGLQTYESQVLCADGQRHDFAFSKAALPGGSGIVGVMLDITERKAAEVALAAEARLLETMLETIPAPVFYKDAQGRYLGCNSAFAGLLLGATRDAVIGRTMDDFAERTSPEFAQACRAADAELFAEPCTRTIEGPLLAADGTRREVILTKRSFRDESGAIGGVVGVLLDITERKQAEDELRRSREQFMLAVNGSQDGIWDWDLRDNSLYLSPRWKQMIGYEDHELPNEFATFADRLHPEDAPRVEEYLARYLRGEIEHYSIEFRFRHRDGSYINVLSRGEAIRDEDGIPYRMAGSHTDTTQRKRADETVRRENAKLSAMISGMEEGIVFADADGVVVEVNDFFCSFIGVPREAILGQRFERFHSEVTRNSLSERIEQYRSSSGAAPYVVQRRIGDAEVILRAQPIYRDGAYDGVLLNVIDVTELVEARNAAEAARRDLEAANRQLEEAIGRANMLTAAAEAANQAKSRFLANMSHEIRTPLNGVVGMTGLLMDTDLSSEQREYAEAARACADSLLTVINDILDYSKIEAGKLELEDLPFDLGSALEDVTDVLAYRAHEKGLEFASVVRADVPRALRGDPGRLRQVLLNLAGNAVKFTSHGQVVVETSVVEQSCAAVLLRFEVTDTGLGIPRESQEELFNPFSQLDGSTTRKYGGTGLGLAISRTLVEMMGGTIGVRSAPGEGSTFWFTVPFGKQEPSAQPQGDADATIRGARVLIVDDNATNRRVLRELLRSWGCQFDEAADGHEALRLLQRSREQGDRYATVLLDHLMPDMNGLELAEAIGRDGAQPRPPLVMLTSLGEAPSAELAADLGIVACVTRPVRASQLHDCLTHALAARPPDDGTAPAAARTEVHGPAEPARPLRVLVAEDNAVNRRVAVRMLERLGHTAEVVSNGKLALEALGRESYDLVLMDVQMPEMDGFEATRAIREREQGSGAHTLIVAMTAHAMKGDREMCLDAGMDGYVAKPITLTALVEAIAEATGAHDSPVREAGTSPESWEPDLGALAERLGGDPDLAAEVLAIFMDDCPEALETIAELLDRDDLEQVQRCAHSLKGAAANVGARMVQTCALELERAAVEADRERTRKLFRELQREWERLRVRVATVRASA